MRRTRFPPPGSRLSSMESSLSAARGNPRYRREDRTDLQRADELQLWRIGLQEALCRKRTDVSGCQHVIDLVRLQDPAQRFRHELVRLRLHVVVRGERPQLN